MPLSLVAAFAVGCSSLPEHVPSLENARTMVNAVSSDPMASETGVANLNSAQRYLREADAAYADKEDIEVIEHKAYLAHRHAEIAREEIANAQMRAEIERREVDRTALAALKASDTARGPVLTLGDVLFDTDGFTLKAGAADTLNQLAAFLQDHPDRRVLVEGHTDSQGSNGYNALLSEHRASSVREALRLRGIGAERISAVGLGEAYPVASNDSAAGRQLNRRVDVVISDAQGQFPAVAARTGGRPVLPQELTRAAPYQR
jgi:outer membrane protein OmpA-like peptidoglycan-associated protein